MRIAIGGTHSVLQVLPNPVIVRLGVVKLLYMQLSGFFFSPSVNRWIEVSRGEVIMLEY